MTRRLPAEHRLSPAEFSTRSPSTTLLVVTDCHVVTPAPARAATASARCGSGVLVRFAPVGRAPKLNFESRVGSHLRASRHFRWGSTARLPLSSTRARRRPTLGVGGVSMGVPCVGAARAGDSSRRVTRRASHRLVCNGGCVGRIAAGRLCGLVDPFAAAAAGRAVFATANLWRMSQIWSRAPYLAPAGR
jgi:hypothetical protein